MKAILDFIPLIAFFVVAKQYGILQAAAALLVATLLVYAVHLMRQGQIRQTTMGCVATDGAVLWHQFVAS